MNTGPLGQLSHQALREQLERFFLRVATEKSIMVTNKNYTFQADDEVDSLQADATSGNLTITLPSPTGNRRRRVIKTDVSVNTVTVVGTINGAASVVLAAQYAYVWVEPTGTQWLTIGS